MECLIHLHLNNCQHDLLICFLLIPSVCRSHFIPFISLLIDLCVILFCIGFYCFVCIFFILYCFVFSGCCRLWYLVPISAAQVHSSLAICGSINFFPICFLVCTLVLGCFYCAIYKFTGFLFFND